MAAFPLVQTIIAEPSNIRMFGWDFNLFRGAPPAALTSMSVYSYANFLPIYKMFKASPWALPLLTTLNFGQTVSTNVQVADEKEPKKSAFVALIMLNRPSLVRLCIDRFRLSTYYTHKLWLYNVVRSQYLEHLALPFLVTFQPQKYKQNPPATCPHHELGRQLPSSLETLTLRSRSKMVKTFQALPPNLTFLDVSSREDEGHVLSSAESLLLPRGLKHLRIVGRGWVAPDDTGQFYTCLPPHLTALYILDKNLTVEQFASLPQSIRQSLRYTPIHVEGVAADTAYVINGVVRFEDVNKRVEAMGKLRQHGGTLNIPILDSLTFEQRSLCQNALPEDIGSDVDDLFLAVRPQEDGPVWLGIPPMVRALNIPFFDRSTAPKYRARPGEIIHIPSWPMPLHTLNLDFDIPSCIESLAGNLPNLTVLSFVTARLSAATHEQLPPTLRHLWIEVSDPTEAPNVTTRSQSLSSPVPASAVNRLLSSLPRLLHFFCLCRTTRQAGALCSVTPEVALALPRGLVELKMPMCTMGVECLVALPRMLKRLELSKGKPEWFLND